MLASLLVHKEQGAFVINITFPIKIRINNNNVSKKKVKPHKKKVL